MQISKQDVIRVIANLWGNEYQLVQKYFGKYLMQLLIADQENPFEGHFINAAFYPDDLEKRLAKIECVGQTQAILNEVGEISDSGKLDKRLIDAWAELRFIDQSHREGFSEIHKVTETADLVAQKDEIYYAFQVTRINKTLSTEVKRQNTPDQQNCSPYGLPDDIHKRLDGPVGYYFWDALERKNNKFKNWKDESQVRCIVIVCSEEELQDTMIRHIACQQIRDGVHFLINRYFDELIWLPDTGNGAWFKIVDQRNQTQCFADWKDVPGEAGWNDENSVFRREMDLEGSIFAWKNSE